MTTTTASRLAGRTAIITGSTSGIGAAIARTLAAEGAHVVISGRDAARGQGVAKEIQEAGGRADIVEAEWLAVHPGDAIDFVDSPVKRYSSGMY